MPNNGPNGRFPSDEHTDQPESTLLPMLIVGLVLIVVGAIVVMSFV